MLQDANSIACYTCKTGEIIVLPFALSCRLLQMEKLSCLTLSNTTASQQSYVTQVVDSNTYSNI